jgi:hypothetical protein
MPPTPGPPPLPPPLDDEPPVPEGPARPAWRSVVKRPEPGARRKGKAAAAAPTPPPPPPPAIEAPRPDLPSWAQWRREYAFALSFVILLADGRIIAANPNVHPVVRGPTPSSQAVVQAPPPRQGLFGACSPRCIYFSSILTHTQDL